MLTVRQESEIRSALEKELNRILTKTHAAVDAEYIMLCAGFERLRGVLSGGRPGGRMENLRKSISVELDLRAVKILQALRRINEHRYGTCVHCGENFSFSELVADPTKDMCVSCCQQYAEVREN